MTNRDPEKSESGTFGSAAIVFPIPQCCHADPEGFGKGLLREAEEAAQHGHVGAALDPALHQALSLPTWQRARKIGLAELGNFVVLHVRWPGYFRRLSVSLGEGDALARNHRLVRY